MKAKTPAPHAMQSTTHYSKGLYGAINFHLLVRIGSVGENGLERWKEIFMQVDSSNSTRIMIGHVVKLIELGIKNGT